MAAACGTDQSVSQGPATSTVTEAVESSVSSTIPLSSPPTTTAAVSWAGAWSASPSDAGGAFVDQTLRIHLTPHRDGTAARIRLSNRFGTRPLHLGRVTLARQQSGAEVVAGSIRPVVFSGRRDVVIPPGDDVVSDSATFDVRAGEPLAVSVWVVGDSGAATRHAQSKQR